MNYQTNYPQQQQYNLQGMYKPMSYIQQQNYNQQLPQIRPVSSIEEVRASPIEFDGSIFYFPDIANKKIYTKFINMDGTVSINLYELKDLSTITNQPIDSSSFITRDEFENVINQIKQAYNELIKVKQEEMTQATVQPQKSVEFKF